jgi:hypothetical protein
MDKKTAGLIVSPVWRELMDQILPNIPAESFIPPEPEDTTNLKPILKGDWQTGGVHSILYWVDKSNPRGPIPSNPAGDSQFSHWEYSVTHYVSPPPAITAPATTPFPGTIPIMDQFTPLPPIPNF